MGQLLILLYGLLAYAFGMAGLVLFILFLGSWGFSPLNINSGVPGPLLPALVINIGLILLFGLQHTVTARQGFKDALTKIIPKAAERSTYVLLSGLILIVICLYWQPIDGRLWHVENAIFRTSLIAAYAIGWILVVVSSFLINHFELFGLQQVYHNFKNQEEPKAGFTDRWLYKMVRHPLQLGVLIGVWATPTMTMTHLLLAVSMTIYIFIGLHYEEKDLVRFLGKPYEDYKTRVPMVLPVPRPKAD
ncbi:MAG: hypothetical protein GKR93_05170 [Gammaproteobacteria bacterium]|nr:hypothetical protein [Gammaproteobacteria bacterium]